MYDLKVHRNLVEKSGLLHIYYANKHFKHWKKRWLHLQDQQLAIYQDSRYKNLEKTLNICNYRISITNSDDSVSSKGYTFKIHDRNVDGEKPIYLSAESKESMTQWINALRLSASITDDFLVQSNFTTDLHPIGTDDQTDYNAWINTHGPKSQDRSYKPKMPVATTTTLNDQKHFSNGYDDEEDVEGNRWYRPHLSSSPYPLGSSNNNGVIHQSSSATMGSWGFDVNRSTNGQTPPSFTPNNNHNNTDHRTITRTPRRLDESTEDYNDQRLLDRSSPPQRFKLRTPTFTTKNHDGNEFTIVDRLVLGPSRIVQSDYYPSDDSPRQQYMPPTMRSRQSSTRSILRRRSKSIGDFVVPAKSTSPPPSSMPTQLSQSYHQYQYHEPPQTSSHNNHRTKYTEHELLAWQNRMLERDHRVGSSFVTRPPSSNIGWSQSPRISSKRGGFNSSQSPNRPMPVSNRPVSVMSNVSNSQRYDYDHNDSVMKISRIIKRYIELLHHFQTFYERITDQLYNGHMMSRNNLSLQQSVFSHHCRKITEQIQRSKPIWDRKIIDLQHLLKDVPSRDWVELESETTFLQRRSILLNVIRVLNSRKDLDDTQLSILNDIDRVLNEDKLAVQLQDELSTLLEHQSLLNDFASLLQWNRQIYSSNEQNRVENILPLLREQITTTDGYVSHVSQQLTELVANVRSLEKYILSYINSIPIFNDGNISSNRNGWRSYNEMSVNGFKVRNQSDRLKDDYQRASRSSSRPLSMHMNTPTKQQYISNNSPNYRNSNYTNENAEWRRRSPSPNKPRSVSVTRYIDSSEPVRGPSNDNFIHDDIRTSTKWSPKRTQVHLNTNNSNNNPTITRIATVKSARRDNGIIPNSILKQYPSTRPTLDAKKDFDADAIDREIFKPEKVDIPDRLIDFGNDEQQLTANERLAKLKKKEEVRKMLSKQSMKEINEHDLYEGDIHSPYNNRRLEKEREKALNLQSALAEEAKEKSRQVAAQHYLNKSFNQSTNRRNS